MKSLCTCLIWFSLWRVGAAEAVRSGVLPLPPADYWTHVRSLEAKKGYETLALFISTAISNLAGVSDPTKLRLQDIDSVSDIEGLAYALDDLANVHTVGIINFKKAEAYNALASRAYTRLKNSVLDAVPISTYFNPRRSVFYFIYYPELKPRSGGPHSYKSFFSDSTISAVRAEDVMLLGRRIQERQELLDSKLRGADSPVATTARPAQIASWQAVLHRTHGSNKFYREFYTARRLWSQYAGGSAIDMESLRLASHSALSVEDGLRDQVDFDSHNWLLLWEGFANLKSGNFTNAVELMQRFFWVAAERDNQEAAVEREQRRIMGAAVDEIRARWEHLSLVIGVAGGIGSMIPSLQVLANAGSVATVAQYNALVDSINRALIQSAVISVTSLSASRLADSVGNATTRERRKVLLTKVTEFNLQVGRYLNQFEQVELYALLGDAYRELGDVDKAIRFYREALSLIELQRSTIDSENKRINFFQIKEALYPRIVQLLLSRGRQDEAFQFVERARARAFLDLVFSRTNLVLRSPADTSRLADEALKREQLSTLLGQQNLSGEQLNNAALSLPPSDIGEGIAFLVEGRTAEAKDLLPSTRNGPAILEYFVGPQEVHVFCLSAGELTALTLPFTAAELRRKVRQFHEDVSNERAAYSSVLLSSRALYEILILPLEHRIAGRSLIIIPHGILHYVPFAALRSGGNFLVENHSVAYAPSASILQLLTRRPIAPGATALILANPEGPPQLPGSLYEAEKIAGMLEQPKIFIGKFASETALRTYARGVTFIHVAAHAAFVKDDPMNSALLLARDERHDGRLRASEMYQLNVDGSIVVLSGCQTGLTSLSQGDELIGLTRPLIYSGAAAVLSSLWRVEDTTTAELMAAFYRNVMVEKTDHPRALQRAQLTILSRYDKPFFWAAFNLTGLPSKL